MTYRPLIAVAAYHLGPDRVARWPEGGYGVPAPYLDALRRADARTAIVSPGEVGEPEELLAPFDGLLLVGGGDVDPARYGAEPDRAHLYGVEADRDAFEVALLRAAERLKMPVLCICRGMQIMNVAYGGTLTQHLPDVAGLLAHGVPTTGTESIHEVAVAPASRLYATTKTSVLACSSHHHQGVDRVGEGLLVSGRSPDGLVEAIEREASFDDDGSWIVGVQWHPEDTATEDEAQQAFFDGLALLARVRGTMAEHGAHGRTRDYEIVPYDDEWPLRFEEEAARVREALGDQVVRIDHVGSTSVPGLAAKPIVDIQVSLRSLEPRRAYVPALATLGYRCLVDPIGPDHEYASRDVDGARSFHLHLTTPGSDWERRHLAFRDWLRDNQEDADAYAALKRDLARALPNDLHTYTERKGALIRAIEARALAPEEVPGRPPAPD
jgi:putative glutamine amidotransferase